MLLQFSLWPLLLHLRAVILQKIFLMIYLLHSFCREVRQALIIQIIKLPKNIFLKTIEQYGDDTDTYIEAKYELAHLYIKTKRYDKAYDNLSEILELYDYAIAGSLPAAYKKLAQIEMDKIPSAKLEELQNSSR